MGPQYEPLPKISPSMRKTWWPLCILLGLRAGHRVAICRRNGRISTWMHVRCLTILDGAEVKREMTGQRLIIPMLHASMKLQKIQSCEIRTRPSRLLWRHVYQGKTFYYVLNICILVCLICNFVFETYGTYVSICILAPGPTNAAVDLSISGSPWSSPLSSLRSVSSLERETIPVLPTLHIIWRTNEITRKNL